MQDRTIERPSLQRAARSLSQEMPAALVRADHQRGVLVICYVKSALRSWQGYPVEKANAR